VGKAATMDTLFASYFETAAARNGPDGGNDHGADKFVEIESVAQCAQVIALAVARRRGLEAQSAKR
jgi:acetylornithine deacetylase/succinyl-diaminopimelate desuccinylase-like protein